MISNTKKINTCKYVAEIEAPNVYTGYLVNGNEFVQMNSGSHSEKTVEKWIAEGHTPEPAYSTIEVEDLTREALRKGADRVALKHVQEQIEIYNETNTTVFSSVIDCFIHQDLNQYAHKAFCMNISDFNVAVEIKARDIKLKVLQGVIPIPTEAEFKGMLPTFS